jgi:hypothetical protein
MRHTLEFKHPSAVVSLYENSTFNLLLLELEGAQHLATQLKVNGGISGAADVLHQLQGQVGG